MIILGIDQSTKNTGAGLIEATKDGDKVTYRYITHRFIPRPSTIKYPESILYMTEQIRELLAELQPDLIAVEAPKDNRGFKATQVLTELLGAVKYTIMRSGYPFSEIPPSTMKKAITGYGWSTKEEVAIETAKILDIPFEQIAPAVLYKSGEKKGQVKEYVLDGSDALGLALSLIPYTRAQKGVLDYRPKGGSL